MSLVLILIALVYRPTVDHCDRVEVNHVYNGDGSLVLDQVIWWRWNVRQCHWEVIDWRLIQGGRKVDDEKRRQWDKDNPDGPPYVAEWIGGHATPQRDGCVWVSDWHDEKSRKWRRVIATQCLETWTSFDRELVEREVLGESQRCHLR